jgi:hypothetical protein
MTKIERSILTPYGFGVQIPKHGLAGVYENDKRAAYEQAEAISPAFYDGAPLPWRTLYRRGWRVVPVVLRQVL